MGKQQQLVNSWTAWRKTAAAAAALAACAPAVAACAAPAVKQVSGARPVAATSPAAVEASPTARPRPTHPPTSARALPEPTWVYPGDPHCRITYRDRGDGTMSWTATVTVAGQLRTHAGDRSGTTYEHDVPVTQGPNAFAAPVPLAQIDDLGGVLSTSTSSYACSVAPQR